MNRKLKPLAAGLALLTFVGIGVIQFIRTAKDTSSQVIGGTNVAPSPEQKNSATPGVVSNAPENKPEATVSGSVQPNADKNQVSNSGKEGKGTAVDAKSAAVTAKASDGVASSPVVAPKKPTCNKVTFVSKASPQKYQKNLLKIKDEFKDAKTHWESLCVRVDNVPVKYEVDKSKFEITIGAVKHADSKIAVSYCKGDNKCDEACVIPHDEFMEALAGSADDKEEDTAGWSGGASKEDQDLEREVASFSKVLNEDKIKGVNAAWSEEATVEGCSTSGHIAKNQ